MEIKTEIENIKECLAGYVGGVYAQAYAAIEFLENELETLRASNRIKQANIELLELNVNRLEALNRSFEANEKRLLDTARVLRDENAKLIAEREAMMKQEPNVWQIMTMFESAFKLPDEVSGIAFYEDRNEFLTSNELWKKVAKGRTDAWHGFSAAVKLLRPLPAQQIPEGYALTDEIRSALELAIELLNDDCSFSKADALKTMLSASQPKGDV